MSISFCEICKLTVNNLNEHLNTEHFLPHWGEFSLETYEKLIATDRRESNLPKSTGGGSTSNRVSEEKIKQQILMIPVAKQDYEFINKAAEALMVARNRELTVEIKTQRETLFQEHNSSK